MLKFGTNAIGKLYYGDNLIGKAYYGSNLVYQSGPPAPPPYDAQVEYLENTGGSYIRTDYIPQGTNIKIQGKFYLSEYGSLYGGWFGTYDGVNVYTYRIIRVNQDNNNIYWNCGGQSSVSGRTAISGLNNTYEFELTYDQLIINGATSTVTPLLPTYANSSKFCVFYNNTAQPTRGKFYYLKVYDGANLVLNLIPVRVGTTGYMYDSVSRQLYENVGTGSFSYGSDIE